MQFSSWSRGTEMVGGTELIQGVGVRWAYFYLMILFCFPWRSETRLSELPGWANTEWIGTVGDILSPEQHFAGAEVEVHLMLCPSPDRPLSATQRNVGSQSSQCSRSCSKQFFEWKDVLYNSPPVLNHSSCQMFQAPSPHNFCMFPVGNYHYQWKEKGYSHDPAVLHNPGTS